MCRISPLRFIIYSNESKDGDCFYFLLQSDVVIIPKSVHKERMQQNFDLFDFTLNAEDMTAIESLDGGKSLFFSHYDPKTVEWFMSIL